MGDRRGLGRFLALVVVAGLLTLAALRLDLRQVAAGLAVAHPVWIALAILCFAAILPLWALQWRLLATRTPRVPFGRMLGIVAMTSTVLNTTPLLVGEAAGVLFLASEAGLARAAALSVLAMDQLFVGIAKLLVLAAAANVVDLPEWMARGAHALLVAVGALAFGVALVAWRRQSPGSWISRRMHGRGAAFVAAVDAALAPMRSPSLGVGALALALAKKAAEAVAMLCMQRAFGLDLPPSTALLVLAAVNLATLVPVVPGNVGVYEGAVVLAYSYVGVPPERALGIALVQHACFFVALALPGYWWMARSRRAPSSAAAA